MRLFGRLTASAVVALLLAAGLLHAQQAAGPAQQAAAPAKPAAPAQQPAVTPADVPRMEAAEVKRLVEKGEAVLVDVRAKEAWDSGHAEGARHIPLGELSARLKDLPKDKLIAAYCT